MSAITNISDSPEDPHQRRWCDLFRRAALEPETLTYEEWRIVLMDVVEQEVP